MKKTVIKFGLLAFLSGFILFGLPFFLGMGVDYDYGELIGYTAMVLSLLFVYFGIKHYRDKENNGKISFRKTILIGMLITFGSAVGVALFDYIYTSQINPDFASEYLEYSINKMQETLSAEEVKVKAAELKQQMEDYGSPGFMAFMMFASVVILGFIITLISGLILQRK
ncbi:DUF4199 domain-containing protein [Algibacter luteus]|uniref:DUF4199 domain-containing protein n=1 Tax=Algibacter luteus TaxID=1178825 RepID=A0A1M6DNK6_9FLAO|nr:DUF4199 domain-containing protein [Algibacter luteus]WJJ96892.1 DUF4199 domain-containing protein [Algibacter luteus]SHI74854.1 Protein of unknown function [Algibacter luteus]